MLKSAKKPEELEKIKETGKTGKIKQNTLRRPAAVLLPVAYLAALLLLAAAPLGWFAVTDRALFGAGSASWGSAPYVSITPTVDDYYLLRLLRTRSQVSGNAQTTAYDYRRELYVSARVDIDSMSRVNGAQAIALLDELHAAHVLTDGWYSIAAQQAAEHPNDFFITADSLGLVQFYCMDVPQEYERRYDAVTLFNLTLDSCTGKVVSLWLSTPDAAPDAPDPATVLDAWVAHNELEDLGDWAAPAGTTYAQSGWYSANGQALATCVADSYSRYLSNSSAVWNYMSMRLSYCPANALPPMAE